MITSIRTTIVLAIGLILFPKCYAPPPPTVVTQPEGIQEAFTFESKFDKTWSNLVAVIAEYGWPLTVVDKESGIISTNIIYAENLYAAEWSRLAYRRVRSGAYESLFGYDRGRYIVNIIATPTEEGGTKIKFTIRFETQLSPSLGSSWVEWKSAGALEQEIAKKLRQRMQE